MKKQSILAIDIGNTTIALAIVKNAKVIKSIRIETPLQPQKLRLTLNKAIEKLGLFQNTNKVVVAVICSVVPKCTGLVEKFIKNKVKLEVKVVGRDIVVPIKNRYKNPKQVGQDRLVGAYAASVLYGHPVIIIDLGTAITFDVVSGHGEYLGGVIVPGLRLSAESLFKKTALLPQIDIKAPRNPIGHTTEESILSGLFYGYGALCRGMIDLLKAQLANPRGLKVVMTGGHTQLMKKFISTKIRIIDEDLVFKGMYTLI